MRDFEAVCSAFERRPAPDWIRGGPGTHEENASSQKIVPGSDLIRTEQALMPLAQAAAFQRDNSSPDRGLRRALGQRLAGYRLVRKCFGQFDRRLRQLLGNAQQMFAPLHLAPDVIGPYPGRCP